jgi:nucleotide-binding universal stress UspA family protein
MTFKTILCVTGRQQPAGDVDAAVSLCAGIGAHLTVLVVSHSSPPPLGNAMVISEVWMEERRQELADLEARVDEIKARLAGGDISHNVESLYTETSWTDNEIGNLAKYADLTLLVKGTIFEPELRRQVVDGVLFHAMRPLLALADGGSRSLKPGTILLAWDSSVEASRAAREALDLMKDAEVHVTLVDPEATEEKNGEEPGADIALYLSRHGIKVLVDQLTSAGRDIADVINDHAVDIAADLIVMGGYGHSRLRETVFGGVTRSMIDAPKLPVLMAR